MDRNAWKRYILETYAAESDCPWRKHPSFEVFRHSSNKKWFALVMSLPQNKLGLQDSRVVDVVNLKCDVILSGLLRERPGFYPAYHMHKGNWITVALDGTVSEEELKTLLDMSFKATASAKKAPKR